MFPIIVVLITLSVLGTIYIQVSWIKNAIDLRKQQNEQDIAIAVSRIKQEFYQRFFNKIGQLPTNESSEEFYLQTFSVNYFSEEEINQVVSQSIKRSGVKQPYEYVIIDIFRTPIFMSAGYRIEYIEQSREVQLTTNNSNYKEKLYLYFEDDDNYIIRQLGPVIIASILMTTIIISAFALTVRTMFSQKKLSEIKSDFINNMTHELKTPLATISLAIDALTNEKVIGDPEKIRYYSTMIKDENKRMNKQVEKILQSARIERQEVKLNLQELNAHEIIRKVTDNLALQIQDREGSLTLNLQASRQTIKADEVHFSNIIFNLLDNAIKYSKDAPRIEVETLLHGGFFALRVRDHGIGMNKETQNRVFEKFYRAHTGNLHNVKGFGLGLSYVKGMVDAHGGKIKVDSTPGKGSTFTVLFPLV